MILVDHRQVSPLRDGLSKLVLVRRFKRMTPVPMRDQSISPRLSGRIRHLCEGSLDRRDVHRVEQARRYDGPIRAPGSVKVKQAVLIAQDHGIGGSAARNFRERGSEASRGAPIQGGARRKFDEARVMIR